MVELLIDTKDRIIVHVAEDGHQWGRGESRSVYDEYVKKNKCAPQCLTRESFRVRRHALRRAIIGASPMPEFHIVAGTERMRNVPPPDRLGVISIPGSSLVAASEGQSIYLADDECAQILAGKFEMTVEALYERLARGN